jgi:hypothetical protein
MSWRTVIVFVGLATVITLVVGGLVQVGKLPIEPNIDFSQAGLKFIRVWIWLAITLGILLPAIALIIWRGQPGVRKVLGFYLVVIVIQIITEQLFSSFWMPSLVITVGTLYTSFRLWQLWQGQQLLQANGSWQQSSWMLRGLFLLLLLFWAANLVQLVTLAWPTILL